jgi:secreted trypsin-like serine protease
MRSWLSSLLLVGPILLLNACSGGSDNGEVSTPLKDACSVIGLNTRIIEGTACSETASPIVRVNIFTQDNTQGLCTGTLLTNRQVLTAAHCFLNKSVRFVFVEVGAASILANVVAVHPQATIVVNDGTPRVDNDVAIVHLSSDLNGATLPILVSSPVNDGDIFSIYGYGLDEAGNLNVLRSGQSKVSSVDEQHITAFFNGEGSNSCNGDSGGPAILSITKDGTVQSGIVGVVSSGSNPSCLSGDESLYAHVPSASMLNFIQQQVPELRLL